MMLDDKDAARFVGEGFTTDATNSQAADGRYYTDESVYREEIDKVFGYEWNYFCHQSQLPDAGDYLCGEVAEQSVYVS